MTTARGHGVPGGFFFRGETQRKSVGTLAAAGRRMDVSAARATEMDSPIAGARAWLERQAD
ncbi:hypothetical protein MKP08_02710 [Erythrobacter sp. LQ02-29]|uniref:hypothetical protein n=1 Tax=Erythrobacter sp. LQ02-29 TaxID=2920384 RepID=UPI001F4E57E1|nr:hypothetical protein [Erythrobacter sp. LQ02-29]MCP9221658.1 hypothetical protein [Erythrobacter sp. LQ02-29]